MELNGQCNGIIRLPEGFFVLSFRQPWCSLGVETCFRANHGLPNPVRQSIGKLKWNEAGYFKKIYMLYFVCVFLSFYFALSGRAATYFLCFAKESKQRKATPVAGLATPNFPHCTCFWRRALVAALRIALVSAKTTFRSTAPRGRLHGFFVSGSLNKI